MNVFTTTTTTLSGLITELTQQKDELTTLYNSAISNGKKYNEVKTLYISLYDINKKLNDLMRISF